MTPVSTGPAVALSLDHAGAIVRDLAAGALRWEKLGFALSPLSRQRGKMPGRNEDGPWATANRCAIFKQGYLELIGVVDDSCFNPWTKFLDRFEGLHLLALRVANADAAYEALARRTDTLNPPVQRERKLDVDGIERTMGFRNIFSRDEHYPEGRYIVLEHQTPEFLWQPRYQVHPNGALGLESVHVSAEDLNAQSARLEALLGTPAIETPEGERHFSPSGGGTIVLQSADAFQARYACMPGGLPCFAGVTIRFASRALAAKHMEDNGVPVQRRADGWFVAPADTNGFVLRISE